MELHASQWFSGLLIAAKMTLLKLSARHTRKTIMNTSHTRDGASRCAREITGMAQRSIALIDTIDGVIDALRGDTELFRFMAEQGQKMAQAIKCSERDTPIDSDGAISGHLREAAAKMLMGYNRAIAQRESARLDPELREDDGVVEAFTDLIGALADSHNSLEDLREAMETKDAMISAATGEVYTDVDKMFADMGL